MNCRFCGTALPSGALFCGECGRAVATPAPARRPEVVASTTAFAPASDAQAGFRPRIAATAVDAELTCPQCGAAIDEDDVFCGACGFVVHAAGSASDEDDAVEPEPVVAEAEPVAEESPVAEPEPEPEPVVAEEPEPIARSTERPADALFGSGPAPRTGAPLRAAPDPFPWGSSPRAGALDLEATRLVASAPVEERFVLQFSTGESVTVTGAGLIGRNPASQPGEVVDQLVTIFDAGKSVSKTHLEFGQDGGRFWVSDRYSTNGSTVRQPDVDPKRCEPGRRYFVARGTRVDIGEQFFVVS